MRIIHGTRDAISPPLDPCAVAIGIFDGVHRGHQALLARMQELAQRRRLVPCVYTFHPHPAQVLAPSLAPQLLEPLALRLEHLADLGVHTTIVESFDREFAAQSPEVFIRKVLVDTLRVRHVVIGEGFTFGHKQSGTVELLEQEGQLHGFAVHAVGVVMLEGLRVSSTKVREFVAEGRAQAAALLLGRPYTLVGVVQRGAGRGASIGFPTANLAAENEQLPGTGVYAAWARRTGQLPERAVVNVGYTPTFGDTNPLRVEAHLLDYKGGPLYDERLAIGLVDKIRDERRFDGVDALRAQIAADAARAREILAGAP